MLPIGAARGIIAAAPASAMLLAADKSGIMYGIGTNPSSARSLTAFIVSALSGSRYLLSRTTSIFIMSPHPSSLASLAMVRASSAFLAPEVLGRRVTPLGI